MKKPLELPAFNNEDEDMAFWDGINLADYYEPKDFKRVKFLHLKPSTKPITLRLPVSLIETIKLEANKRDVPYQSYIKMKLSEVFGVPSFQVKRPASRFLRGRTPRDRH
jgi:predicted DNA binding CopG/RHH family protein